ncbi:uncharacterized protein E5676_scaffold799G00180 [Cucumis melo var. makuwa]|uniref:Beta-galactosidase n=1 Tax=Cucumis melo var. makuwa TaxID=1194695 RepID=A0A5D3E375_CUCMM|nr:uncharacterized protein E6C27_scaffold81G00180 [Cucumis melo var. makuwa]TYK30573.1 uncharacterized protein E5676_scaffold799G00180 [Cucumis melo var. makuwa]
MFRKNPDQNRSYRRCRCRRPSHHHRKTTPKESKVVDLSNGPTLAAVRATFRPQTTSRAASVGRQPFFYSNGADQLYIRLGIEAGESSATSGYGQSYVCGLRTNQTYKRAIFEVGASSTQMHSKNPNNGKPILVCEYDKKQWHTKDQCWKLHGQPPKSSPTLSAIAQSSMSQSLGLISVDGKNPWILESGATDHLTGLEFEEDDWHNST